MPSASTVTRKGQATIPSGIRRMLGLCQGDTVVFREDHGQIILEPAPRVVTATAGEFRGFVEEEPLTAEALRRVAEDAMIDESRERAID
jgi:AbrB family looped-hinge helix DNA binding protein